MKRISFLRTLFCYLLFLCDESANNKITSFTTWIVTSSSGLMLYQSNGAKENDEYYNWNDESTENVCTKKKKKQNK